MTNQIGRRHLFKAAGAAGLAATLPTASPGAQPAAPHNHGNHAAPTQTGTSQAPATDKYLKKPGSLI